MPWWTWLAVGVVAAVLVRFALPSLGAATGPVSAVFRGWAQASWVFALPFCVLSAIAYFRTRKRDRLLQVQTDIDSIRALDWRDFELLVGEAFRRQGYQVEERGGSAPDGGVDLVLRRGGVKSVVQCKRWRSKQVGVPFVRELYGVMTSESAGEAVFVSSGEFTAEARAFVDGKPIRLIDGAELVALVRAVQGEDSSPAQPASGQRVAAPACPRCGSAMVERSARSGAKTGRGFWGCSAFPTCRGTRPA
jgi:restriction system protein